MRSTPGLSSGDEHDRPDGPSPARVRGAPRNVFVLDAPVSGSVSVAEAAQLFAMVGGDEGAYERARPVLDATTKGTHPPRPVRCGCGDEARRKLDGRRHERVGCRDDRSRREIRDRRGARLRRPRQRCFGFAVRPLQAGRIPRARDPAGFLLDRLDAEGPRTRARSRGRPRPAPSRGRGGRGMLDEACTTASGRPTWPPSSVFSGDGPRGLKSRQATITRRSH